MGFLSRFLVETKAFELSATGVSVLRLAERGCGISQSVFLGKVTVAWLLSTVEMPVQGVESTDFFIAEGGEQGLLSTTLL